jgi:ring-1,2-phenylacetyl-CoA epoxidase subunit PaaE
MSNQFYKLKIKNITKETADSVSISFEIPSNLENQFKFEAGQYLTLKADINGEDVRRAYSISSAPYQKEWKVAIKAVEGGKFSTYAQTLSVGSELEVMAPFGNFTVKSQEVKNYVLFAAGSGITPIISIAKYILNANSSNRVILFYGNKSADSTIYKDELDTLHGHYSNFEIHYIFSRESGVNDILSGRIDQSRISSLYTNYLNKVAINEVYSCGPEEMIFAVKDFFIEKGINENNVHFELFTVSKPKQEQDEVIDESAEIMSHVKVIVDDEEFEFDLSSKGKFIMQAAQDADADVPFSCKGGVCCTCKAKVMEGKVKMDLNFALDADEVEEGFVLTCQSRPLTKNVTLSFDEY